MRGSALAGVLATALVLSLGATSAHASPEDVANDIAAKIMSPFCPGVTLDSCPTQKAAELRSRIQSWVEAGWGEERILDELEDLYGESIRALPPKSGSGLWAWIIPALALIAGAGVAWLLARRWTRRPRGSSGTELTIPAEAKARLNDELDALRGRP